MRTGTAWILWAWMLCGLLCASAGQARAGDAPAGRHCVRLKRVELADGGLLAPRARRALFRPYSGRCIDGALLKSLIAGISEAYMRRGYVTTRPYLKPQSIADGVVRVSVLRGVLADVVDAGTGRRDAGLALAFAFQRGRVLNLRDIETALEMVNRPPSVDARFRIRPGDEPGTSVVEVERRRAARPWQLRLGLSGRRQDGRDEGFATAEASWDNPLGVNDIMTFRLNGGNTPAARQSTRSGELSYSFPVASVLLELSASRFFYRQGIQGIGDVIPATGRTTQWRVRAGKVAARNRTNKLTLAASVVHRNNRNYLDSQLIGVSSYRTTVARLEASHQWLQRWGSLSTTLGYDRGVDWFGARRDGEYGAPAGPGQPRLQFVRYTLDAALDVRPRASAWGFSSRARVQATPDALFDSDRIYVGGDYTVRGYPEGALRGNDGWHVRNELARTWRVNAHSELRAASLFVGADYGRARCGADNAGACGEAAGIAAGVRTEGAHVSAALTAAWPLRRISPSFRRRPVWRLDTSWRF